MTHSVKRRRQRKQSQKTQANKEQSKISTVWRFLESSYRLLGAVVLIGTVIGGIVAAYQITLVPEVHPDSEISSSWYDLPITVKNPSLFEFKDVRFSCYMTEQEFEANDEAKKVTGQNYYRVKGFVEWPIQQPLLAMQPSSTTSFPCNIAENSTLQFDDTPLPMMLIHLSIKTDYSVNFGLFRWHRHSQSQTFTWKQVSGGWQWLPGETLRGPGKSP